MLGLSACDPIPTTTVAPPTVTAAVAVAPTEAAPAATTASAVTFGLSSPAFEANGSIPAKYSCKGDGTSPALSWTTPPEGTQSLALLMDDPDAASVAGHVWDHWVIFNIPPSVTGLPEDIKGSTAFADGTVQGQNSSGGTGYQGPCPPGGQTHGYVFTLYAVDSVLALNSSATKADVLKALEGHTLAQAQLIGKYPGP